ncbi:hypothetical protein KC851_00735 [Candidatus Kaiserbacteria bacterium]|nr:hypothetical protein [Candidatus Kaiserbacteria bacterium]
MMASPYVVNLEEARNRASKRSQFIELVGIELEGFTSNPTIDSGGASHDVVWDSDAGLHQCELIVDPLSSADEAFTRIERVLSLKSSPMVQLTPRRPDGMGLSGHWQDKQRYNVIRQALSMESRKAHLVTGIGDWAALHINFSGTLINPLGNDGAFLVSLFNAIGPFIAHKVHQQTGIGAGHLSLWQDFAREERLPLAGRWFANSGEMISYFEGVPKLIKKEGGQYVPQPGENQHIACAVDQGVTWWFMRVKLSPSGVWYLESRILPSMPINLARHYTKLVIEILEKSLCWFYGQNDGQPVGCLGDISPLLRYLREDFAEFIPDSPLSTDEWLICLSL